MKKCGDDCHEICDFCVFYRDDDRSKGELLCAGEGDCILYGKHVDIGDGKNCDGFWCFRHKE